jgi:heparan-alpha-glucosaminide N-acetyltransferase
MSISAGLLSAVLSSTGVIPISKNLWSLSFVLASASIALSSLLIFYLLIDVAKLWPDGIPFNYAGVNAIFLYVGHEVGERYFPFYFDVDGSSHAMLLFRVCFGVTIWALISVYMAKKEIYLAI